MSLNTSLLFLITTTWVGFEIWLVIRDNLRNVGKTAIDRGTRNYNFLAITVGLIVAGSVNGLSGFFFPGGRTNTVFFTGIAIMLAGIALRVWSIYTLGIAFRTTIETHSDQKVISHGPYRFVRHPSYSGLVLMCCGFGIAVQNWLSLLIAVALPLAALLYRIRTEEAALVTALGPDYIEYQKHTKRLVPWIW